MSNLKWRLLAILGALALSAWFLFPRDVTVKRRDADGFFRDTVERRVPLKRGLDLNGGMQMTLEIDDSKQAVPDKADAIDRALKTVRTRVEGFGVSEPVVQKLGDDRINVELPGMQDQERAAAVMRDQAFLEFKITDEKQALEKVLPRLDAIVRERRLASTTATPGVTPGAPAQRGLQGLLNPTVPAQGDSTRADTAVATG